MNLLDAILRELHLYLDGRQTLAELDFALAAFDQAALDAARSGDERAEQLLGRIAGFVSEWSAAHRSEDSVRAEIERLTQRMALPAAALAESLGESSQAVTSTGQASRGTFTTVIRWPGAGQSFRVDSSSPTYA